MKPTVELESYFNRFIKSVEDGQVIGYEFWYFTKSGEWSVKNGEIRSLSKTNSELLAEVLELRNKLRDITGNA